MSKFMDGVSTVNSFLRTLLVIAFLGGFGIAGYYAYTGYHAKEIDARRSGQLLEARNRELATAKNRLQAVEADVAKKTAELRAKDEEIARLNASVKKLELAVHYLKIDHRVARFTAVDQFKDEALGEIVSVIEFVELNDAGQPIETPRRFHIRGDLVYIDGWVVKFDDKYVEQADLERGTSLLLFKRIFGSGQRPDDGFPLDETGQAPRVYSGNDKASDFEQKIWADFWTIANDPDRARQLGIRAAHGGAPFMKVEKGKSYRILLRASGDPTIVPDDFSPTSS